MEPAGGRGQDVSEQRTPPLSRIPRWLRNSGLTAWFLLGIIALVVVAYYGLARLSALLIPLVVAVVLGMIFHPVVDVLARKRIPRPLGALLVMLGLTVVIGGAIWLAVAGVIDQSSHIGEQLQSGWTQIQMWLKDIGIDLESLNNLWEKVSSASAGTGLTGAVQAGFTSVAAFVIGLFIGAFLMYYLLKDWHLIRNWVASHIALPEALGRGLIDDATTAIRRYFYGLTLASIPVALGIGLAMWLLGIPLVAAVVLVTFITSYIPYLGAIFSGASTVLIALGSAGLWPAIIMLIVVLITQNGIQTLVQTKLTSDQLNLHPIVNLGSTIVGATMAGLLGATLSAPIVAMVIAAQGRVRSYYAELPEGEAASPPSKESTPAPTGEATP